MHVQNYGKYIKNDGLIKYINQYYFGTKLLNNMLVCRRIEE